MVRDGGRVRSAHRAGDGIGGPGAGWAPQVEALAPAHRLLFFDGRGIGRSAPSRGLLRVATMAGDALALMDHRGFAAAHVVGISMGSQIALEMALAARQRVLSLALLSTWSGRTLWRPTLAACRWTPPVVFRRGEAHLRALGHQLFSPAYLERLDRRDLVAKMGARLGPRPPVRTIVAQLAALLRYDARPRLAELAGLPTLVMQGGRDILVPPGKGEDLARRIPGARFVLFPGCGHGLSLEASEEVNRELAAHVARAEAAGATPASG